jgi:hypothetical protein
MDEQCLADIAASIIGGQLIDRSKEALDSVYESDSAENARITEALDAYGSEQFREELKYCIDELLKVCASGGRQTKLRNIVFERPSTNAFPAVFAILMIALHEALIGDQKKISNYEGVKSAISGLYSRVDTSRKSTTPHERRKNADTIKGLISAHLVDGSPKDYSGGHSTTDIDVVMRRSEIELPHYELKQGILTLNESRQIDPEIFDKVVRTICAVANNGKERAGTIIIGVTDKDSDAQKIKTLDGIEPRKVGKRFVVGIKREAKVLGEKPEAYFARWKNAVRQSTLSQPLRDTVLSAIDYNEYFGLGLIIISVPPQKELSFVGDDVYSRQGDETVKAADQRTVAHLAKRFA